MSRERNATVEPFKNAAGRTYWRAKIWLLSGERIRVNIGEKNRFDQAKARAEADAIQAEERRTNAFHLDLLRDRRAAKKTTDGETASEWFVRYTATRTHGEALGNAQRWTKWIDPILGSRPMADLNRDDVEAVRDALDAAIADKRIAFKTGSILWSVLTTACRQATNSKDRSLRVLAVNPCIDVLPPESGDSRSKPFLYPSEAQRLFACEEVPADLRAIWAVSAFLFTRPNETAELRRSDFDFEARVVRVSRALDWSDFSAKAPKTRNGIRVIPLHENLIPLLKILFSTPASRDALLFPDFRRWGKTRAASKLRSHLQLAGVDRARLFESTATEMPIGGRSWRDSGITWHAIIGTPLQHLQRWSGHDDMNTTMGYVRTSSDYARGGIGEPFGPLPVQLLAKLKAEALKTTGNGSSDPGNVLGARSETLQKTRDAARQCASIRCFAARVVPRIPGCQHPGAGACHGHRCACAFVG